MDIIAIDDPTDAQIQAWHEVLAAGQVHDQIDGPVPAPAETAAGLLDGSSRLLWAAVEAGAMVGFGHLRLPYDAGRAGEIDIQVRPDRRRHGAGTRLLAAAADRLRAVHCSTVVAQVLAGTPAVPFVEAHGFRCVLTLAEMELSLRDVDRARLCELAAGAPAGYRVVRWTGHAPNALAERFAAAKIATAEHPAGEQMKWDVERVREMTEMVAKRGDDLYTVAALHEDGVIAGFTEMVVPRGQPWRAVQHDTTVAPGHRGRRIGIWLKASMLEWLIDERPEVAEIETDNADDNEHMLAVNEELGFRRFRESREYLADLADLPTTAG